MIRRLFTCSGSGTDPYRNLALERYLTETVPEDACVLYLWQNQNTVVIGRNQNAWKECRTGLLEQEGGVLARRLSGGGAVFHDSGQPELHLQRHRGKLRSSPAAAGHSHGLPPAGTQSGVVRAQRSAGRGAEVLRQLLYAHNGRAFHNGTLLVDADMTKMGRDLSPSTAKITSKGVDSVRSRVVNLRELCPGLTIEKTAEAMDRAFEQVYGLTAAPLQEQDFDHHVLDALYAQFSSRDWVYGRSAPLDFACGDSSPGAR